MTDETGTFTYIHTDHGNWRKEFYNPGDLSDVNRVRVMANKTPLTSLNGYCMSTGCSCAATDKPNCGLFKSYEIDGIEKDFLYEFFGI